MTKKKAAQSSKDNFSRFPPSDDETRWEALMRGQIITTTSQKFLSYVKLADQKAQGLIFLNTILVPIAFNWVNKGDFGLPALISVITALCSILAAIVCIYPKRRGGRKPDGTFNYLHFGDIGHMKEDEYIAGFKPIFNNIEALSETAMKDLHDTARRIVRPKFFWLKISYLIFFIGNLIAVGFGVSAVINHGGF